MVQQWLETEVGRMVISLVLGVAIGLEREFRGKAAGLRTFTLICVGSTMFTILSKHLGFPDSGDRVASNIVTGIGFLGAGVIFKAQDRVAGLTTAAAIWATSSIGMAVGVGNLVLSLLGMTMIIVILLLFHVVERKLGVLNQSRIYRIIHRHPETFFEMMRQLTRKHNLEGKRGKQTVTPEQVTSNWLIRGRQSDHEQFINELMKEPGIKEIDF